MQIQAGSFFDEDHPMPGRDPWANSQPVQMTPAERRRWELQQRVVRARQMLPPGIVLRIFKEPEECTRDPPNTRPAWVWDFGQALELFG
jgi:hypothetical protein